MNERTYYTKTENQKFVIHAEATMRHSIRAAVYKGRPFVSITDVARCCGLKAPGKASERFTCEKVKLATKLQNGRVVQMLYCGLDDASDFVRAHSFPTDDFADWFTNQLVPDLRQKDLSFAGTELSVVEEPQSTQKRGNSVNLSERIDRMIIELLSLKQEIS